MPQVLKTREDDPDARTIVGAGHVGAHGRGGIVVQAAAEAGFPEFVECDAFGRPVTDDETGGPVPLKGKALAAAAEALAERAGLEIVNVKDPDPAKLAAELGAAPDRPPAEDVAVAAYEQAAGITPPDPKAPPATVAEPAPAGERPAPATEEA